jgi:hypothetical protein
VNSSLTISASVAENSHGGCFRNHNPLSIQPYKLRGSLNRADEAEDAWAYNSDVRFLDTVPGGMTARINMRAWVVQESILSHRVLHFREKQMFWEYNSFQACEVFPEGVQKWPGSIATVKT